jgi:predicted ATP-grasp superfamily ATP-dependent carboligase
MNILLLTFNNDIVNKIICMLSNKKYNLYVLSNKKKAYEKYSIVSKAFFHISRKASDEKILELIMSKNKQYQFDKIIPTDIKSTIFIARNKEQIKEFIFPISDEETHLRLHNKWEFYNLCSALEIPVPHTSNESLENLNSLIEAFPKILKPVDKGGGKGVEVIRSKEELSNYISNSREKNILVQDYIPGHDRDISLLALNGKILYSTVQEKLSKNTFRFIEDRNLEEMAQKLIKELNFSGFAHFDLRVDKAGNCFMIECNPRIWDSISASKKAGIDYLGAILYGDEFTNKSTDIKYGIIRDNIRFQGLLKDPFMKFAKVFSKMFN